MPIRLDRRAPDFGERFRAFLATKREASADVDAVVRAIIADVAARGDRALIELSRKLDRVDLDQTGLRVGADEIDAAYAACDRRALDALPLALAAAKLAGLDEIYRVGGAQAVAALAHGTETIAPVAKIVGPGNAYVAAAKRIVFGKVGIDMIAGPSEVLILADKTGHADWIAADLLAQAEHDASAQPILITDDAALAEAVETAVGAQLPSLPRAAVAGASWRDFGAIILVGALADAVPLVDAIAPEHLEIHSEDAERLAGRIRNAGAIFLGPHTPEAIGDYVGGSNHVLPTARSARFSSGLGVLDFMKRISILKCGPEQLRALGPAAIALGEAEGLDGHARSVAMRFNPR